MGIRFLAMVCMGYLATGIFAVTTARGDTADPVFIRVTVQSAEPADASLNIGLSVYQRPWQHMVFAAVYPDGKLHRWADGGTPDWTAVPAAAAVKPGQSTPWIDLTALFAELKGGESSGLISEYYRKMIKPEDPKTLSLSFTARGQTSRPRDRGYYGNVRSATVTVEFATAPDTARVVHRIQETIEDGVLGIRFPQINGSLPDYAPRARSMFADASMRLAALQEMGLEEIPPAKRLLSSWVKVGPFAYDRRAAMVEAKLLRLLGVNVLKDLGTSHSVGGWSIPGIDNALALEHGFQINYHELSGPPKALRDMANPNLRRDLAEWMRPGAAAVFSRSGIEPGDRFYLKIEDEPHLLGVDFSGKADAMLEDPRLAELFRTWLREKGFTPADVGARSWEEVRPYARLHRLVSREELADDAEARLYVQTIWFLQERTAAFFKAFSDAARDVYGPQTITNTCIPYTTYRPPYLTFTYRPDYFIWSRLGVMGMQNHHYTRNAWQPAEESLLVGDFIRSASHFGEDEPGVLWGLSGPSTQSVELMGMSALIRGIGNFYQYYYSPIQEREQKSDAYDSIEIAELLRRLAAMGRTFHLATRIEDHLQNGRGPDRQVAYLHSRAGELWYKPGTFPEVRMLAGALSYINATYDVLPEEAAAEHLKEYKVVYVLSPNLGSEAFAALRQWVENGGVLVCTAGSLQRDELDRPADYLQQLAGQTAGLVPIGPPVVDFREIDGLLELPAAGQVRWNAAGETSTFTAYGRAESMDVPNAQVLARWADGSAAAAVWPVGKGQVVRYGFAPGTMLARSAQPAFTDPVMDDARVYDDRLLKLYAYPIELANVGTEIRLSQYGVDAGFFELDGSAVVLLANYRSTDEQAVNVKVLLQGNYTTCTTRDGKVLNVQRNQQGYTQINDVPLHVSQALFLE